MRTILLLINPAAGKNNAATLRTLCLRWAEKNDWRMLIQETSVSWNCRQWIQEKILEQEQNGAAIDIIGAAGGDGTISEVIDAIFDMGIPLLILPVGSTNIFAMNFAIPADSEKCLDLLEREHEIRQIDLMRVNGRHRIMNTGVGFNSNLILYTTREEKRKFGVWAYIRNIIRTIRLQRMADFLLSIDEEREYVYCSEIFVMNVGFGMTDWIAPEEFRPDDGIISIFVLRPSDIRSGLAIIKQAFRGKPGKKEIIQHYRAHQHIRIECCSEKVFAQADGEIIGETPVDILILPHQLKLITPVSKRPYVPIDYVNKYLNDLFNSGRLS